MMATPFTQTGRWTRRLAGMTLGMLLAPLALADDNAAAQLTQRLEPVKSYTADFKQVVAGAKGQQLQQAEGQMWIARPGKFRWVVKAPYAQTVVSDGRLIHLYDPDLEQVTVRKLDPKVTNTPALLLSGRASDLTSSYNVSLKAQGDQDVFQLTPKTQDTLFDGLTMSFKGQQLTGLDMQDASGQQTHITFSKVVPNGPIAAGMFDFKVPDGAEVIREN